MPQKVGSFCLSLEVCWLAVKDFHTINNMFESLGGQVQRKKNQVLKLFFFAILVQEFEIKVENLCVVRFLRFPVRRVLLP